MRSFKVINYVENYSTERNDYDVSRKCWADFLVDQLSLYDRILASGLSQDSSFCDDMCLLYYLMICVFSFNNIYFVLIKAIMCKFLSKFFLAVSLFHFQTMLLIQKGTVLQCSHSLPIWKQLSGRILFGLVVQRRSWTVLVK